MALWRPMHTSDVTAAHALSEIVHPDYPEDRAVFEERHRLYPAGCFVLAHDDGHLGYALSHPYVRDQAPALNTLLGALPEHGDSYYFHDIAILPQVRNSGAGNAIVSILKTHARDAGFETICLIAVNNSAPFWERHGFVARESGGLEAKLASYGERPTYMTASL